MNSGTKETCCTHCVHSRVCSLKEELLKMQEAVDNVKFYKQEENGLREIQLSNIDWIKPANLQCIHFLKEPQNFPFQH